ncbi:MAG TPA: hypothetical protein VGM73_10595 [Candidatus Didemnitutus sp.]|jgi:hypothetical protein
MRLILCLALLCVGSVAAAETINWPGVGKVTLTASDGWEVESRVSGTDALSLLVRPKSEAAAVGQFTIIHAKPGREFTRTSAENNFRASLQQYVDGSVEKKANIQLLELARGYGWHCRFTDANLVGKPPVPGDYKYVDSALAVIDPAFPMIATLQFDDPTGPKQAEMLAMVRSLQISFDASAQPVAPARSVLIRKSGDRLDIIHNRAPAMLRIEKSRLVEATDQVGLNESDSYFILTDSGGDTVSGWFEPADKYPGLKKLWETESDKAGTNGVPPGRDVAFLKVGDWEVVSYDFAVGSGTSANYRAESVKFDTWIDLHLSITSKSSLETLHQHLHDLLLQIEVRSNSEPPPKPI